MEALTVGRIRAAAGGNLERGESPRRLRALPRPQLVDDFSHNMVVRDGDTVPPPRTDESTAQAKDGDDDDDIHNIGRCRRLDLFAAAVLLLLLSSSLPSSRAGLILSPPLPAPSFN